MELQALSYYSSSDRLAATPVTVSTAAETDVAELVHTSRIAVRLLWVVCGLLAVFVGIGQLVQDTPVPYGFFDGVLAAVTFTVIGGLILPRRPGNVIGWLFVSIGLSSAFAVLGGSFAGSHPLAWMSKWLPLVSYGLMPLVLLLFPEGTLPSRRWRAVAWIVIGGTALAAACVALAAWIDPLLFLVPDSSLAPGTRPLIQGARVGTLLMLAGAVGSFVSLVVRWRRAEEVTRQQLKFLALATVFLVVGVVLDGAGFGWAALISVPAVPVATGVAILRYRLYDIDLFLNRSLVYATLTVLLLGAYLGLVAVLSPLFAGRMRVGALVATAVVALIFEPLRSRLQRAASRLLYGDRDDPYAAVSRLGRRLEQSVDPSDVLPQVTETVAEVLHLPYAAIEAVDGDRRRLVASYGRRVMESEAFRMIYQGDEVGALLVTPRSPSDVFTTAERRLLEDLARQIGVAVQAARLTSDLQRSRERLVRSREEERRRLRRDLHDGLGPTLAGMTMQVGAARARLAEQGQVVEVLAGLEAGLQACVAEIRRLVEGLRPPVLDQLGLVGAIRHLVMAFNSGPGHSTPTIGMTASDGLGELPAAVEVAAYRIVTEAVTNTVRHARASRCEVRLTVQDRLILEISDDGVGLPGRHHPGVGLSSMRERAEELGGRFVIKPLAGGGTLMHAELPLDAR